MNSTMHQSWRMGHLEWLELAVFLSVAAIAVVLLLIASFRLSSTFRRRRPAVLQLAAASWQRVPEIQLLVIGLPLELLWEIAQFPLYTVWHEGAWSYILYGLAHCTLGDLVILLAAYEITAVPAGTRYWPHRSKPRYILWFTLLGVVQCAYQGNLGLYRSDAAYPGYRGWRDAVSAMGADSATARLVYADTFCYIQSAPLIRKRSLTHSLAGYLNGLKSWLIGLRPGNRRVISTLIPGS